MSDEDVETVRHKFSSLSIFKEPLCLIHNHTDGCFKIDEEVLGQISQIDLTVNVIAITGPYRTGKSYLMNRLAKAKHGFAIGNEVTAKTKGVWAWCLMHPVYEDQVLILLDTEGIGDTKKKDPDNDNKLLCITALICGTFIYNVKGVVDRDTLDKLGFITFFARNIGVNEEKPQNPISSDLGLYLPKFVLCLRDFSHNIDKYESPSDYLEDCLALDGESNGENVKYDQIRACIRQFFVVRKCFVFDIPVAGRKMLTNLENTDDKDLLESFLEDTDEFMRNIYEYRPKELLDGKCLNGNMFSSLIKTYVLKINNGGIPCIQNALSIMANQENKNLLQKVIKEFKQEISSIELPFYDMEKFQKKYQDLQENFLREFQAKCILAVDNELFKEIEKKMDEICKETVAKNIKIQKEHCNTAIKEKYASEIKVRLDEGRYRNADGYAQFKDDIKDLKSKMKQKFPDMDETMLYATFNDFENSFLQDEELAKEMSREYRKELKEEHQRQKKLLTESFKKKFEEDKESYKKWKEETENNYKEVAAANVIKINEKVREWEERSALQQNLLKQQNEKITMLLEMLSEEENANKSSVGKTLLRGASSLLPVIGPMIFESVDRSMHSKRKNDRKEKINNIKQSTKNQSRENTEKEKKNASTSDTAVLLPEESNLELSSGVMVSRTIVEGGSRRRVPVGLRETKNAQKK